MEKILEVKNLCKEYKDFSLKDVSFSLDRGFVMGFIGANGAGKSTTIKLIMNLIRRNNGEIKIFGRDNIKDEREIKEKIGFVYEDSNYYWDLTVRDNAKIISRFYKNWDEKKFREYLHKFEISDKKKIKQLSRGMRTKFALAIALSHGAEFLIMDEPTSGLDPVFRSEILDLLYEEIQDERKSVLFSTHITSDLEKIADYITFINDGKIEFSKEKDIIQEEYKKIIGPSEVLQNINSKDFIGLKENSFAFEGITNKYESINREILKDAKIVKPTLEEIMLYTIGGVKE